MNTNIRKVNWINSIQASDSPEELAATIDAVLPEMENAENLTQEDVLEIRRCVERHTHNSGEFHKRFAALAGTIGKMDNATFF